jgi:hypothetical protein
MTELIGLVAVAVVAWFAAGTIWNVRLGREMLRWMQSGLSVMGQRTTVRWLGSSVVEMVIRDAKAPYSAAAVLVFLEPRDLPWWPVSRLRGRRDTLIVRGVLRRSPAVEFEALDPKSWSARDARSRIPADWRVRDGEPASGMTVHYADPAALARVDAMLSRAQHAGLAIRRLSLRRTEPNLQIHVPLPDRGQPAREFFEAVRALAELALD